MDYQGRNTISGNDAIKIIKSVLDDSSTQDIVQILLTLGFNVISQDENTDSITIKF